MLPPEPDAPKLHKVLAQAGIGSRRDMEDLIVEGRITVNGEPAHTGQRISFGDRDRGRRQAGAGAHRAAAGARSWRTTSRPARSSPTTIPQHRPTVFRRLPRLQQGKWQSVGRLDINTEGLLLFTNSGDLANQLMHPRFGVEREYAVRVLGTLDDDASARSCSKASRSTASGRRSSRSRTAAAKALNHWYRVVITEGRNREVRKLFDAVGLTVSRLIRIRYGTVVLPRGLKRGVWVDLDEADVRAIRRLASPQGDGAAQRGARPKAAAERAATSADRAATTAATATTARATIAIATSRRRAATTRRASRRDANADAEPSARPRGDDDIDDDFDPSRIPNPLQQTFDKRFVQGRTDRLRTAASAPAAARRGRPSGPKGDPKQPDPLQTSVGYIGADAFHRKNRGGIAAAASAAGVAAAEVAATAVAVAVAAAVAATAVAVAAAGAAADPTRAVATSHRPLQSRLCPS